MTIKVVRDRDGHPKVQRIEKRVEYPYIIKAHSKTEAEAQAKELGLSRREWRYMSESSRRQGIDGLRTTRDRMIGNFTDDEIWCLTAGVEDDKLVDEPESVVEA